LAELCELLAQGLGHDVSVLENFTDDPVVNLKLLHYPPHDSNDRKLFGAGAHTDFGTLTILLQLPGKDKLQVYHDEQWLQILGVKDVFVVNMGNLSLSESCLKQSLTFHDGSSGSRRSDRQVDEWKPQKHPPSSCQR